MTVLTELDVNAVADPPRTSQFHRHEWHAHAGDDRWRCSGCPAEAHELRRVDKTIIPLPKAAT